jgi:protein-S-isoprenylcysteine O-methyltransferase Ste14
MGGYRIRFGWLVLTRTPYAAAVALTALVLYAVFMGLTGGLRVAIQVRRTGSTGVHGLRGRLGSAEWLAGALFVVGAVGAPVAPLLDLTGVLAPIAALDAQGIHLIGMALVVAGTLLTFGAQLAMGDSWRVGVAPEERTALVTGGPFAIVRNPIYGAIIPAVIGFTMMVPSYIAIADLLIIVIALELQVRVVEEPHLLRVHGDAYRDYASRVGRFAPGVGLIAPVAPRG